MAADGENSLSLPFMETIQQYDDSDISDPVAGRSMLYTSGTTGRPKGVFRKENPPPSKTEQLTLDTAAFNPEEDFSICPGPAYHAAPLGLNINPSGVYLDCTFGRGGHSKEILKKLNNSNQILVVDAFINWIKEDQTSEQEVILSLTSPYFLENYKSASGANVFIEDEEGKIYIFNEEGQSGRYLTLDTIPYSLDKGTQNYLQPMTLLIKGKKVETENLASIIKGSEYPDEYIIITAHLDHIGIDENGVKKLTALANEIGMKLTLDNQIMFHVKIFPNVLRRIEPIPVVNCARFPEIETPLG